MDILQALFSLWTGNRCTPEQPEPVTDALKHLIPEDQQDQFTTLLTAYCDKRERQAFDVGFKAAAQLCQQLNNTEEIYGGLKFETNK
ncbi:hypothetical protein [Blautia wexlerae]|uniref:hypothetical protein n=1 Tax=Blautia wexlerae TaxID=418240 RepID=UPI00325A9407